MLKKIFAVSDPRIEIGIGDDAAIVRGALHQVVTTDMAVEDVHFKTQWTSAFDIGRKITVANLADIFAMNGKPEYLAVAISLTGKEEISWIEDLARGIRFEADKADTRIIGGDTVRGEKITISMTAIGSTDSAIGRDGAKIGDDIYLSSLTGWSAAGLALLSRGKADLNKRAVAEFSAPTFDYGFNTSRATSLCDISDSIITQSLQVAKASGVCFSFHSELFTKSEEFTELANLAAQLEIDIWQWIFAGGEDHVLMATGKDLSGLKVGQVLEGDGVMGLEMKKAPDTWRHFN